MVLLHTGLVVDTKVKHDPLAEECIYRISLDRRKSPCSWRVCCGTCDKVFGCCRCNWCGTYSSSCSCVPVPTALFITSRRMRAESLQVFYSSNPFAVKGTIQEVLLHLLHVPTERLRWLKRLHINVSLLPHCDESWYWDGISDLLQERPGSSGRIVKIFFDGIKSGLGISQFWYIPKYRACVSNILTWLRCCQPATATNAVTQQLFRNVRTARSYLRHILATSNPPTLSDEVLRALLGVIDIAPEIMG